MNIRHSAGRIAGLVFGLACLSLSVPAAPQSQRSDLDGVWILAASAEVRDLELTPAGQAAFDSYDHFTDDPAMRCIPASFTRVMHTPSPPIELRQHDNYVEINYEFMDVRRRVPLDPALTVESAPVAVEAHPHMGRSIGRYDGETLVVETAGQHAGILDTLGVAGLPQSDRMRTVERFIPGGTMMYVEVTHFDPVNYVRPMVVTFPYLRLEGGEILEWGCVPEEAGYERFTPTEP